MQVSGYAIDILVTGFPGKSVCHGALGWSSIVLIRHGDRLGLIDVGAFGHRKLLLAALAERGLKPGDVTDVLLTHSHYDHALNWVLFPKARTVIAKVEMDWALTVPWGETPVPELYVRELNLMPRLARVRATFIRRRSLTKPCAGGARVRKRGGARPLTCRPNNPPACCRGRAQTVDHQSFLFGALSTPVEAGQREDRHGLSLIGLELKS